MAQNTRTLTLEKGRQAGKQLVTPYSDVEALYRLQQFVENGEGGDFAADLAARGMRCSPTQMFWVHKLLLDLENHAPAITYGKIIASYTRGRENGVGQRSMKMPVGRVEEGQYDGAVVQLSIAGNRSKHSGCVWVTLPQEDHYCGRIGLDGVFYKVQQCPDEVLPVLQQVEDNVEEMLPW